VSAAREIILGRIRHALAGPRAPRAADYDAIPAKLEELDPALKPLIDKRDSDADALKDKLDADQQAVADASKKLLDDLKAWHDAHQPGATANA